MTFYSDPNWEVTEATSSGGVREGLRRSSRSPARASAVTYDVTATLDDDCPVGELDGRRLAEDVERRRSRSSASR